MRRRGFCMPADWKKFLKSENAATAIEYALIAVGISITIAGVAFLIGDNVNENYTAVEESFQ
jgi:Flp pilus assembly pilin Flp